MYRIKVENTKTCKQQESNSFSKPIVIELETIYRVNITNVMNLNYVISGLLFQLSKDRNKLADNHLLDNSNLWFNAKVPDNIDLKSELYENSVYITLFNKVKPELGQFELTFDLNICEPIDILQNE